MTNTKIKFELSSAPTEEMTLHLIDHNLTLIEDTLARLGEATKHRGTDERKLLKPADSIILADLIDSSRDIIDARKEHLKTKRVIID